MQKLAGLITESEYKQKLNEAENIASKIDQNLDKIESLPAVQQAAEKIMSDPKLLQQFQQGLAKMGVDINLMKEGEGEDVSASDISKIVAAAASKEKQISEYMTDAPSKGAKFIGPDEIDQNPDKYSHSPDPLATAGAKQREAELKDVDNRGGAILRGLFGAPVLVGILSKVSGAGLFAALGLTALGATPALLVTMAVGGIIGGVVGAIAHKKRQSNKVTESKMTKKELKNKIREMILDEAKKKKDDEEPEDVAPQADVDMEMPAGETADALPPTPTDAADIDPNVKNVQDLLQKAFAGAKQLGDEKLMNQIGNTITMFVRTQVLGGMQNVAENLNEDDIFNNTYKVDEETYTRMDSSVNPSDYDDFIDSATKIMSDLTDEGFEVKDVFYYLYTRLTAEV